MVVLEDNDVLHLRKGAYGIFNWVAESEQERQRAVPRALETLNMEVSQIMKGGYDTFMQAGPWAFLSRLRPCTGASSQPL